MNKKLLAFFLVLTMMFTVLVGCGSPAEDSEVVDPGTETPAEPAEQEAEASFVWNVGSQERSFDPQLVLGGDFVKQGFEGLVREKSGVIYPGIAEDWDISEDGLTMTFNLRESNWSDGTPVTAHDFVYSWKRGIDPKTASESAGLWRSTNVKGAWDVIEASYLAELDDDNAETAAKKAEEREKLFAELNVDSLDDAVEALLDNVGFRAEDDYTFVVELDNPTEYVLSMFGIYHFAPVKQSVVEQNPDGSWAQDPELFVGNGPFKLDEFNMDENFTIVKNPEYWNADSVKIDSIKAVYISDQSTAYQAYLAGEVDWLQTVPLSEVAQLMATNPNFYNVPLQGTYFYQFNVQNPKFEDKRVRRAINLALDREAIVQTKGSGEIPAIGLISPGYLDHEGKDFYTVAGDYGFATDLSKLDEAKQLMADAGYPNGEGFPEITIIYNTAETHQILAELMQEMLSKNLGLKVKLENQEWAVYQETRNSSDFEISRFGFVGDYLDPLAMLDFLATGHPLNNPQFNNARFDELIEIATNTIGKEHFDALYEAYDIVMDECPVIPFYHFKDIYLINPKIKGWDRSNFSAVDFSGAYIEE